jgi:hypothetical protein
VTTLPLISVRIPPTADVPRSFLHPLRGSTMASASRRPKGRDGVLSTLHVIIQALDLAQGTCGIPPAQVAFGSVIALLTMIRVFLPLLCANGALAYVYLGHAGQRSGLCRPWAVVR